jgi:hypothetical protein
MCRRHWRMVSKTLQAAVWRTYQPGQEVNKRVSDAYLQAAARAIIAVGEQEGQEIPPAYHMMATQKEPVAWTTRV